MLRRVALAAAIVTTPAIAAEIPRDLVTANGALLCVSPFKLDEAAAAISDPAWLKSLLCVTAPSGVPVKRIDSSALPNTLRPWQVRLMPPGGPDMTLWGYHYNFRTTDGRTMIEVFRSVPPRR